MKTESELTLIQRAAYHFMPKGGIVAGGALTSAFSATPINDVDIYFKDESSFRDAIERAYDDGMWCVDVSKRSVTFAQGNCIVQLMHFEYFTDAHAVFDAFDFTCCMGAYDIDAEEFVFSNDFLKHVAQRHLSFHGGTRFPFASLLRVLKYQSRGYTIGKGDLLRIALACHRTPVNSWDDLADQIGGQYGQRVKIEGEGDFSIDAAIDIIANSSPFINAPSSSVAGNAQELFAILFEDKK
jgi:hypothetical protein